MNQSDHSIEGLSAFEAGKRLTKYGLNQMAKTQPLNFWDIFKEEVTEPMILLLIFVGIVYSFWGKLEDALTIFFVITILVLVEVWNEYRAKKAIAALSKLAAPKTKVIRDGKITEVETEFLVPGDILIINSGTRISADARLVSSLSLQIDESSLTGESLPLSKEKGQNIYAGTVVVAGEGKAEVVATGLSTRFGKISSLAQVIKQPKTPLQISMKTLAKNLVWVALFFSISIPLIGVLRGQDLKEMILTGLALSFAVIPEELPIIITMILGLGAYYLSKNNFLVKKIKATEVLGGATVILTDKTGTLTENDMQVVSVFPEASEKDIISSAASVLTEMSLFATDKAIKQKSQELNLTAEEGEIIKKRDFGDSKKTKAVIKKIDGRKELYISGAPEEIFELAKGDLFSFKKELDMETGKGRRVIAVAVKDISSEDINEDFDALEKEVALIGLISLEDPARKGVKETLATTKRAGIRTIMVTGDHPQTALSIAQAVGIDSGKALTGNDLDEVSDEGLRKTVEEVSVFARCTPEHKYRLLKALQANGEIVAVTGDGVNDALALKGANIGIAMGIKGTDVAKEAADVVLADDNYNTIARAIFEGRKFFDNLRKGLGYYLSVKTALVLIFALPAVVNIPFPFSPIQIIILELFMDLAASSGFVAEPAEATIYTRPPRNPQEKLLDAKTLRNIAISGFSLFAAVMIPYFYALSKNLPYSEVQTIAFSAWIMGHIILAFVFRSEKEPLYALGIFSNKIINLWMIGAIIFLLVATQITAIGANLKLQPITLTQLGLIFIIAFCAIGWREVVKMLSFRKDKTSFL